MASVGARFDDRITGRLDAFSPGSKKIHIDIDPSSINKNVRIDIPIVGDCANVLGDILGLMHERKAWPDPDNHRDWWRDIARWRRRDRLRYRPSDDFIMLQYALERLYALTRGHDTYITTEVGQHQMGCPVLPLRGAEPLDDVGRARHHGLRPAVGDRRPGRPSQIAGHRHCRRCPRCR